MEAQRFRTIVANNRCEQPLRTIVADIRCEQLLRTIVADIRCEQSLRTSVAVLTFSMTIFGEETSGRDVSDNSTWVGQLCTYIVYWGGLAAIQIVNF